MVNKNKSVRSHMDSQPSLSQTSHQICASRGKRSMRSKELVQLAGNLIRLALSAINAECLSDILFLSCSASEQLHSSLSSYAKVDRAHPHTRIYKRSFGASLYVSACSIYFCIATPTSSLTATRAELYYFVVVIIHVRGVDE